MNRDNYFRCKHCKELFPDEEGIMIEGKGLQCPKGCVETFKQPDYESPLQQDNESKDFI